MIIKELTPTSWIVTSSATGQKVSLVLAREDLFVAVNLAQTFSSWEEMAKHLNESVEWSAQVDPDASVGELNGYPVKHPMIVEQAEFTLNDQKIWTYKRKINGKQTFAAGFFGIAFNNGYVLSYCPLLDTLTNNASIGPFATKFDAQFSINRANKGDNI